jgi:SPP1 gp7 family putative phage head morphogenesis protein
MMRDPLAMAYLRYVARLDGMAAGMAQRLGREIDRAINDITADIARRSEPDAPWTFAHLQRVRDQLLAFRQALAEKAGEEVTTARLAVAETVQPALAAGALAVGAEWENIPVESLLNVTDAPYRGKTWQAWGQALADDTASAVLEEMRQSVAMGESVGKATTRLQQAGIARKASAEALARTIFNDAASRTALETMKRNRRVVAKVVFSAVMDGRTSLRCASYSGREFDFDDPELANARPPLHPRCRSVLLPRTVSMESLTGERGRAYDQRQAATSTRPVVMDKRPVKDIPKDIRPNVIRQVPADWTFNDFLNDAGDDFAREYLGDARFRAWKAGVPLNEMARYDRELTIDELRALYPDKVTT